VTLPQMQGGGVFTLLKKRKLLSALQLAIGLTAPQLKFPIPTEIWELEYGVFAPFFCGLS